MLILTNRQKSRQKLNARRKSSLKLKISINDEKIFNKKEYISFVDSVTKSFFT